MTRLFVHMLGEVSLTRDGETVPLPPKPRLLLALLVATRHRGLSSDELLDVLYDGTPPPTAESALRVHVAKLRDALEPGRSRAASGRVASIHHRWQLRLAPEESDIGMLEASASEAEAVGLGDVQRRLMLGAEVLKHAGATAYPGLTGDAFEEERARLGAMMLTVGREHLGLLLDAGAASTAAALARRLLALQPYDEGLAAALARAVFQESGAEGALRVIREFRGLLADELGLDASPVLDSIESALLRNDTALGPQRAAMRPSRPRSIIGRETELESIAGHLDAGESVVLSGPAGIGKTTLLRALAEGSEAVLATAAGTAPYSLLRSILSALPEVPEDLETWRRLRSVALGQVNAVRPEELPLVADDLCRTYLREGMVVLVDDAELPDRPSLDVLGDLIGGLIRVVVARRPGTEASPDVWQSLNMREVALGPLDREESIRLAARTAPGVDVPADLWERTGGVPLLVEFAMHPDDGPGGIAHRLLRRLSPEAIQLARGLAVLGPPVAAFAVEGLHGSDALAEVLVSAVAAEKNGLVGIAHPLVRDSIIGAMDRRERRAIVKSLIESDLPPLGLATAVTEHGEGLSRLVVDPWAVRAGEDALGAGDAAQAESLFDVALGSHDPAVRAAAEHGRARSHLLTGDIAAARADLVGVMNRLRELGEDRALVQAITEYVGMFAPQSGDVVALVDHADWLLERGRLSVEDRVAVRTLTAAAARFGDIETATAALLRECDRSTTPDAALAALIGRWRLALYQGRPAAERLAISRPGLDLVDVVRETGPRVQLLRHLVDDLMACGRLGEAERVIGQLREVATAEYDTYGRWWVDLLGVEEALRTEPGKGLAAAGERYGRWPRLPEDVRAGVFQTQAFVALYQLGQHEQLLAGLIDARAGAVLDESGDRLFDAAILLLRAEGRSLPPDTVAAQASDIARSPAGWRRPAELFMAGRAAASVGRLPDEMLEAVAPYADEWVLIGTALATLGPMSAVLADLLELDGRAHEAARRRSQAQAACGAMKARWWAADVARA